MGIVGTGVGGKGWVWSPSFSLVSRRVILSTSFLSILTRATAQMYKTRFPSFKSLWFRAVRVWLRWGEASNTRSKTRRRHKGGTSANPWALAPSFLEL